MANVKYILRKIEKPTALQLDIINAIHNHEADEVIHALEVIKLAILMN